MTRIYDSIGITTKELQQVAFVSDISYLAVASKFASTLFKQTLSTFRIRKLKGR
jgi:hypothetical protein